MMNYDKNYLQTLISQGNDAQTNMYLVKIDYPGLSDVDKAAITVRCKGFTPPQIEQQPYSVKFLNVHIDRPRAKITVNKYFDITFRVDVNYRYYTMLFGFQKKILNGNSDVNRSNINIDTIKDSSATITVSALQDNTTELALYKYYNCWIESITPVAYKQGTSDPAEITVRFNYLTFEDLQYSAATETLENIAAENVKKEDTSIPSTDPSQIKFDAPERDVHPLYSSTSAGSTG